MVYDVNMQRLKQIPTLEGSRCAVEINPSRTLFATMARHSYDIQIYRLPTLDPILIRRMVIMIRLWAYVGLTINFYYRVLRMQKWHYGKLMRIKSIHRIQDQK